MKLNKLCALALAGLLTLSALAGCTSSKTVVGGTDSETSAAVSDGNADAAYASLGDYLADPDVKADIDASIADQTDDSMTIQVYADGSTLVYEYQFTDQYDFSDEDLKSVQDSLKESCDEMSDTFTDIAQTLEDEVGLSDIGVRLVYLNGDGSEIYTHEYK